MQTKQGNTIGTVWGVDYFIDVNAAMLPSVVAPAAETAKLEAQLTPSTARASMPKRTASGGRQ